MIGKVLFVENDLFGIVDRLREIDEGYFVVYSYRKRRFEVHHREQKGGTLAFVVPYPKLDVRTLCYARESRRERQAEFILSMEKENAKKQRDEIHAATDKAAQRMAAVLSGSL